MKKVILPLAIAAAFACSNNVSAEVPNWYNYQGVCAEKSAQVELTLALVDAEGNELYKETQSVLTNAAGVFTAQLGKGYAETGTWPIYDLTSSELTLVTSVNGAVVSKAKVGAVPYATIAETCLGLEETQEDVMNLTRGNKENKAAIADIKENMVTYADLMNYNENVDMTYVSKQTYYDDQAVIEEGLSTTQEDVMNLTRGNKENKAAIADLKLGLEQTTNLAQSLSEDLYGDNGLALIVESLQNALYGEEGPVATLNQMDLQLYNNLLTAQEDIENIQAVLSGEVEGPIKNLNQMDIWLNNLITDANEQIDVLNEGLATTQEDVMNLTLGNKENKAAIADIKENMVTYTDLMNYNENVDMVYVSKETYYADQAVVEEGLATTQEDVMNLTLGNKENKAAIATLKADLDATTNLAQSLSEDIYKEGGLAEIIEGLMTATDDIPGIQETLRNKANVDVVEALADGLDITQQDVIGLTEGNQQNKAAIAELKVDVQGVGELVSVAGNIANANAEAIEALQDGLDNTQQDVINLTEGNKANASEIKSIRADLNNLGENIDFLSPVVNDILERLDALEAKLAE